MRTDFDLPRAAGSLAISLAWLVFAALPAAAQEAEPAAPEPAAVGAAEAEPAPGDDQADSGLQLGADGTEEEDFAQIDELLLMDEEVRADPGTYSYDPGTRRDPFRSLIRERADSRDLTQRPEGIPGLLIDEIEIEGVFVLEGGPVAQIVSASQRTSFLLRPGDQLWDGEVVGINMQEVIFKQSVNDPTALKPFREVVKELNP